MDEQLQFCWFHFLTLKHYQIPVTTLLQALPLKNNNVSSIVCILREIKGKNPLNAFSFSNQQTGMFRNADGTENELKA